MEYCQYYDAYYTEVSQQSALFVHYVPPLFEIGSKTRGAHNAVPRVMGLNPRSRKQGGAHNAGGYIMDE